MNANEVAAEDVRQIAEALGLGTHARPYSAHEVVQREILPALNAPHEGDRVRLTYGDGSSAEGTWRAVLELDDGTLHTHTRGQVRREVIARHEDMVAQ